MVFNSLPFLVFLPVVFVGYWFLFSKSRLSQNLFLLLASYFFYSCWNWHFLFLLIFSTLLDYSTGLAIDKAGTDKMRTFWLRLSIIINLGLLCYFKYYDFFIESFVDMLHFAGLHINVSTLNLILPIGISFYTFHGISYVLDIYYGKIESHKNFIDYALFVSYFPLLVAGPIERATHLLPQLKVKRNFDHIQAISGLRLALWGMFKKVVIADSLGVTANYVFDNYSRLNAIELVIGVIAFSFQIYGDFSGYTDIARGVSKMLGIDLIKNFDSPYLSKNISEFWGRWHMSLTSWLNDYVFMPLSYRFRGMKRNGIFISIFITFLLSGLWHGAGWHYVIWGALHALYFLPVVYSGSGLKTMTSKNSSAISFRDIKKILFIYFLICFSDIFFRAPDLKIALSFIKHIGVSCIRTPGQLFHMPYGLNSMAYILPLIVADIWLKSDKRVNPFRIKYIELITCWIIILMITLTFQRETIFIYFKF